MIVRLIAASVCQRSRGALGDDHAVDDYRDAIGEVLGLVHVVGREEDRLPERP